MRLTSIPPRTVNAVATARFIACLLAFLMTAAWGTSAFAQMLPAGTASETDPNAVQQSAGTDPNSADTETQQQPGRDATADNMSADQIIEQLSANPDQLAELKSMAAARLQAQGTPIQPEDISDEMLFDQIRSSPSLQANVSEYLRTRETSGLTSNTVTGSAANDTPSAEVNQTSPVTARRSPTSARDGANGSDRKTKAPVVHASTDAPTVLHRPAPYNLQSMRDLYTQIPEPSAQLTRFGSEMFVRRNLPAAARGVGATDTPLDVPVGPDYVLGPGDTLSIAIWGGVTQSLVRPIGRDGRVLLPEAGSMQVAGLPLGKAQQAIAGVLAAQYRNAQVAVTVSQLHSVRVYVVGDVQRPGGYDISSLATPLSALYAAGGPTAAGSLRTLRHLRGTQLIEEVDLYDFLLHGMRNGATRFESGDTIQVPPAGPQVAVRGAVKRPAIYELKSVHESLAEVVDYAGGLTAAASFENIVVDRIAAHHERETIRVPSADGLKSLAGFSVQDGDNIRVEPILPYSQRAVYLEGHVARPGRRSYQEGMRLSDLLGSYRDLLPEPAERGEIVRLHAPDLHAETMEFSVPDVLIGNNNIALEPFDTVRIFGRYEVDAPRVTIRGEVTRPGEYPLSAGMTVAQLVRQAGGLKRDALRSTADLASYVHQGGSITESVTTVQLEAALKNDTTADIPLKAGDVLSVHQITGWNDIGESVTISGEVRYPGTYGFRDGERLSAVLRRAGGMLPAAYPMGAVLLRTQVRELEEKSRDELVRQIEANSAAASLSPGAGGDASAVKLVKAQQAQVLADLRSHPATGRMVIHIGADIESWAGTPADIELRRGDELTIPKRPGFILVTGQVYNATALSFSPGKTAAWYLRHAGGTNSAANRREIFIIRANGSLVGRHSGGLFSGSVLSTKLDPGDVIVVPQKIVGASLFWRNLLSTAQIASSIAITASVAAL